MPKRDPDLLIQDMREAVQKIEAYIAGLDHAAFLRDSKTIDSVVRNLEVLGEAARQLPGDFTARFPLVPWNKIAGLRNRNVHANLALTSRSSGKSSNMISPC